MLCSFLPFGIIAEFSTRLNTDKMMLSNTNAKILMRENYFWFIYNFPPPRPTQTMQPHQHNRITSYFVIFMKNTTKENWTKKNRNGRKFHLQKTMIQMLHIWNAVVDIHFCWIIQNLWILCKFLNNVRNVPRTMYKEFGRKIFFGNGIRY